MRGPNDATVRSQNGVIARETVAPRRAEAREHREASHLGTEGRGKRAEKREKRQGERR